MYTDVKSKWRNDDKSKSIIYLCKKGKNYSNRKRKVLQQRDRLAFPSPRKCRVNLDGKSYREEEKETQWKVFFFLNK